MIVRGLDNNGDWTFGRGLTNYLTESNAIAQCVRTKLLSLKNDWFLNRDDGIAWFDYLEKNPDIQQLERDIKNIVSNIDGVEMITDFDLLLDNDTRVMQIQIGYDDKYKNSNEVNVNVTSD